MKIIVRIDINNTPQLQAAIVLGALKKYKFYNTDFSLRHPLAIYNISISAVITSMSFLLDTVNRLNSISARELQNEENNKALISATDQYLDSIMEHMDDCLNIIKSLYGQKNEKKYKKSCRVFNQHIKSFRDHIAKQVNHIKHSQARIRLIVFYNKSIYVPGYFIEGVLPDEVIGPHPVVHPGSNSAFSYSREIRHSLCGIFFISNYLANIIKAEMPIKAKGALDKNKELGELILKISGIGNVFFPDEYKKPIPNIKITSSTITIEYPCKRACLTAFPPQMKVKLGFMGDGVTKTFKMPHFGSKNG